MKKLNAQGLKILKSIHLILVMLWTVGVIAMAVLFLMSSHSGDELYTKYKAIRFIDDVLVVPSATLTILVGIVYGVWTNWGFFKYRWITVKWILGIAIVIVGTFVLSPMLDSNLAIADVGRDLALADPKVEEQGAYLFILGCCSSLALVFLVIISVFKPWKKAQARKKEIIN